MPFPKLAPLVKRLPPALAGLLLLGLAASCAVNPVTGQQQFTLMSERRELAMGEENYPHTTQMHNGEVPHDPGLQLYVSQLGRRLAALSHRPGVPWEFNVVNTGALNAYALPGGKISVTRGLICRMKSEDELASVLGHEIGHVTARHIVARYSNRVLMTAVLAGVGLALSGSDYSKIGMAAAGAAGGLMMISFSRDDERQADDLGFEYMTRAGYNPRAMVSLFRTFKAEEKSEPSAVEALLRTHPLNSERIAAAQRRVDLADTRLTGQPLRIQGFNQAMRLQRMRRPAYQAMEAGDRHFAAKRYQRAAQYYRKAARLFPGEGLFYSHLALAQLNLEQFGAARRSARRGAELSPRVFFSRFVAGVADQKARDWQGALVDHRQADDLLPVHPLNKLFLGVCYERAHARSKAVRTYRALVKMSPKSKYGQVAKLRLKALDYKTR